MLTSQEGVLTSLVGAFLHPDDTLGTHLIWEVARGEIVESVSVCSPGTRPHGRRAIPRQPPALVTLPECHYRGFLRVIRRSLERETNYGLRGDIWKNMQRVCVCACACVPICERLRLPVGVGFGPRPEAASVL